MKLIIKFEEMGIDTICDSDKVCADKLSAFMQNQFPEWDNSAYDLGTPEWNHYVGSVVVEISTI